MNQGPPTLSRDEVWAVLQWLPWYEQLRLRRVCRAWCSAVDERMEPPIRSQLRDCALPALSRCCLRELQLDTIPDDEHLLLALPTTLRRLSLPDHASPALLTRLVQLEDLDLTWVENDSELDALCSLHALTRLAVSGVNCSPPAAARAAAAWPHLCSLRIHTTGTGAFEEAMLLHGPASLTTVLLRQPSDDVAQLLSRTSLPISALTLPHLLPLPLERWPHLCELDIGVCTDSRATLALLRGLATACPSLWKLQLGWGFDDAAVAPALGALTGLAELTVSGFHVKASAIVTQLPRLVCLTSLALATMGRMDGLACALAGLTGLHSLAIHFSSSDPLAPLTQLRRLTLFGCGSWEVLSLPTALDTLFCMETQLDLSRLSRLTALRRLVLDCDISHAVGSWGSLVRLNELILLSTPLPRSLLFTLEATLPALRSVQIIDCPPIDPLPLTSRVFATLD